MLNDFETQSQKWLIYDEIKNFPIFCLISPIFFAYIKQKLRFRWLKWVMIKQNELWLASLYVEIEETWPGNYPVHHIVMTFLNPLRAKLFRGNIYIYLHFVSFLHIDTMQVVEILPQVRHGPTYSTWSISWLLMSWRRKEPGYQQPSYWPS